MNTPQKILELRDSLNHPMALRYCEIYNAVLVSGKIEHGRSQPSLNIADSTPFVIALRKAISYGIDRQEVIDVIFDSLSFFYRTVQPGNAATWLGLPSSSNSRIHHEPPWASVLPWRARSIDSYRKAYEDAAYSENRSIGRNIGIEDGWLFCGPMSETKILIEAQRLLNVLRAIHSNGYIRSDESDGDVRATALVNDRHEWRWLITAGNHRAAAAAALGYEEIPIRVNLVISRCDYPFWKHVTENLYTKDEALMIFDNIFSATPVKAVQNWFTSTHKNTGG